jgi:hypothetical protein
MEPKEKANDFYNHGVFRLGEDTAYEFLTGIIRPIEFGSVTIGARSIRYNKMETGKFFFIYFNDKVSKCHTGVFHSLENQFKNVFFYLMCHF